MKNNLENVSYKNIIKTKRDQPTLENIAIAATLHRWSKRNRKKKLLKHLSQVDCKRAILTGHNASFDLSFINEALKRNKIQKFPLHSFSSFDTATLSGVFFGQTVLARAMSSAKLKWDPSQAHSAVYDAEGTAVLFCKILNLWDSCSPRV